MEILSPGYWQEQDLELGTLAPLGEAISSTVWSSPDMLASQGENPGPSSPRPSVPSTILTSSPTHVASALCSHSPHYHTAPSDILVLSSTPSTSLAPPPLPLLQCRDLCIPYTFFPR